jgi:acetamidase/formamidase
MPAGTDWNDKPVANGPNPQTGPFYVDGAEPGDMLVVSITKLETNRRRRIRAVSWRRTPWTRRR